MNDEVRETLAELCKDKRPAYVFVSPKDDDERQREVKKGFHTACRLAGIEGLIWKDLRATFGTRLAEAGCDAFTIAQLLGHSDQVFFADQVRPELGEFSLSKTGKPVEQFLRSDKSQDGVSQELQLLVVSHPRRPSRLQRFQFARLGTVGQGLFQQLRPLEMVRESSLQERNVTRFHDG